jgi:GDP-4-dehydro-6-deoxy-D-mannose reductase
MRILVTGADGFVGRHLIQGLLGKKHEVLAGLQYVNPNFDLPIKGIYFELTDQDSVLNLLRETKPEGIIHLAAQSMVQKAWENPAETFLINTVGTIYLVNAMKEIVPNAKLISVGSSEEYGLTGKCGEPLTEEHPCKPQNPYATSKLATGQTLLQMAFKEHLNIIHVRPFNHFGPGQREGFVVSDFASQIAKIEKGINPPIIKAGDLSAKRDFTDVRDVIEAYIALVEQPIEIGIYNICSGIPRSIQEILKFLVSQSEVSIRIEMDKERFRPSEVPLFIGSNKKIKQAVGWKPKREFEGTLVEVLNWWRNQTESSGWSLSTYRQVIPDDPIRIGKG